MWRRLRLWGKPAKPGKPLSPAKFGATIYTDRETIYASTGTIPSTQRFCTHYIRSRKIEPYQVLPSGGLLGRAIVGELLRAEQRGDEHRALETLLAVATPASHLIEFGYTLRDGSRKELFRAALNCRLPGWDADAIAQSCCKFLVFVANEEAPYLSEAGRICPPPTLTQAKVFVRIFWLTVLFRRYRRFWFGTWDEP